MRYTLYHFYFQSTAAIFDFRHTQTSDSIAACLSVLPDPENMGITVEISLLSCVQADKQVYLVLEAAILNFSLPVKLYNLLVSSIG